MATQVQIRRGTTAGHSSFTGAVAELSFDTDLKTIRAHDGTTAGGIVLAKASDVTTAVANLVNSAPATLDTLNEIALALNSDNNFAATVITQLGNKANTASLTTANVIELNSLYFTDARARQAISTSGCTLSYSNTTGIISFSQGNTDTVNEGSTNLYFTNARSRAAISVGSGGSYDNSTGIITITGGFVASSVTVFPGHSGNEDYGDLTTTTVDAFGVATGTAYDCMEPVGSLVSEDLVVL